MIMIIIIQKIEVGGCFMLISAEARARRDGWESREWVWMGWNVWMLRSTRDPSLPDPEPELESEQRSK